MGGWAQCATLPGSVPLARLVASAAHASVTQPCVRPSRRDAAVYYVGLYDYQRYTLVNAPTMIGL